MAFLVSYRVQLLFERAPVLGLCCRVSINQSKVLTEPHTGREEKPHPSTTTGGANPASRSGAGLGGYERVATALVCETRSFSTPFIVFQWRARKLMDATSAGVSSPPGGGEGDAIFPFFCDMRGDQ